MEGCCDSLDLNDHKSLPFYSSRILYLIVMSRVSQSIATLRSQWLSNVVNIYVLATLDHLYLDTRAVIVLPDWSKCKAVTKELKLIK